METTPAPIASTLLERFNAWLRDSVMIKLFSIGFLILILLIPSVWIQELMHERQRRAGQVIREVTGKWSDNQTVAGPVLVIPYKKQEVIDRGKDGVEIREHVSKAYFLPETLDINGHVDPKVLHRGIFEAVVYEAKTQIRSTFAKPDFKSLSIPEDKVMWEDAQLVFSLTDLGGISDNPVFISGDKPLTAEPSDNIGLNVRHQGQDLYVDETAYTTDVAHVEVASSNGIIARLGWTAPESFNGSVNINLNFKGSNRLDFIPCGKTTNVRLTGAWSDPSFDGEFLPDPRELTDSTFTASWKILHFNRPFSQQWTGNEHTLSGANSGVKLLIPVDQYQKSIRTSKYGVLVILLTFIALFLVEITQKVRIHPFQYILIGAALTIYYTLLLSFSEQIGYNSAYAIASLATVGLIALYATTFLQRRKLVFLFTLLLLVFYTFIFVIILQQDLALLLGSIGLFLIIGLLMYFSRKVQWYKAS
jgi:inner membrane protein